MAAPRRQDDLWSYRDERELGVDVDRGVNLAGFDVVGRDGETGRVEEATYLSGKSYLVVEAGSETLVLPAGVIERIDLHERTISVPGGLTELAQQPPSGD